MRTLLVALTALVMTALLGPTVMVAKLLGVKQGPNSIYAKAMRLWARSLNVAAYRGQTVRVQFRATTDGALPTTFRVDDVSLR